MIIILEGPDGGGKSTLARQLSEWRHNTPIHHEGPPPKGVRLLEHYGALVERYYDGDVIFDRLALGELIYGPVLRGEDRLGELGWRVFRRLITARNALQVICLPPWETAYDNWSMKRRVNGDLVREAAQYQRIYTAYKHRAEYASETLVYDYTVDSLRIFKNIISHMSHLRPLQRYIIGAPGAVNLFVGDRGANPRCGVDLPFFAIEGSSLYLHQALELSGIEERHMTFMNARNNDGSVNEIPPMAELGGRVVALGNQAARVCHQQRVAHTKVPHPQWWRRFRHRDMHEYAALLRGDR